MKLYTKSRLEWNDRTKWSLRRLFYHIFAMQDILGRVDENPYKDICLWIESSVDESIRRDAELLCEEAYETVQKMKEDAIELDSAPNYKIDKSYPMCWENLPNNLRYNDYFDMYPLFDIPFIKEVQEYVRKTYVSSS